MTTRYWFLVLKDQKRKCYVFKGWLYQEESKLVSPSCMHNAILVCTHPLFLHFALREKYLQIGTNRSIDRSPGESECSCTFLDRKSRNCWIYIYIYIFNWEKNSADTGNPILTWSRLNDRLQIDFILWLITFNFNLFCSNNQLSKSKFLQFRLILLALILSLFQLTYLLQSRSLSDNLVRTLSGIWREMREIRITTEGEGPASGLFPWGYATVMTDGRGRCR